jgi:hypothetical protein
MKSVTDKILNFRRKFFFTAKFFLLDFAGFRIFSVIEVAEPDIRQESWFEISFLGIFKTLHIAIIINILLYYER